MSDMINFHVLRHSSIKYGNIVRLARWLKVDVDPLPPRDVLAQRVHKAILEQEEQNNGPETLRLFPL